MGGIGSGRHRGAKATPSDYRSTDVRHWNRDGWLAPQSFVCQWLRQGEVISAIHVRTEPGRVLLTYRHRSGGEDWKDESYPVYLDWTVCNPVGERPWFLCPARDCGRRVAILYGGGIFACRHCYQLAYPSQRETWDDRAARRADRIRDKLGWKPGNPQRQWLETQGDALEHFRAIDGAARCLRCRFHWPGWRQG